MPPACLPQLPRPDPRAAKPAKLVSATYRTYVLLRADIDIDPVVSEEQLEKLFPRALSDVEEKEAELSPVADKLFVGAHEYLGKALAGAHEPGWTVLLQDTIAELTNHLRASDTLETAANIGEYIKPSLSHLPLIVYTDWVESLKPVVSDSCASIPTS